MWLGFNLPVVVVRVRSCAACACATQALALAGRCAALSGDTAEGCRCTLALVSKALGLQSGVAEAELRAERLLVPLYNRALASVRMDGDDLVGRRTTHFGGGSRCQGCIGVVVLSMPCRDRSLSLLAASASDPPYPLTHASFAHRRPTGG